MINKTNEKVWARKQNRRFLILLRLSIFVQISFKNNRIFSRPFDPKIEKKLYFNPNDHYFKSLVSIFSESIAFAIAKCNKQLISFNVTRFDTRSNSVSNIKMSQTHLIPPMWARVSIVLMIMIIRNFLTRQKTAYKKNTSRKTNQGSYFFWVFFKVNVD